ncbi:hypothetical protein Ocin01_09715 [Orchesella cincta]|uniref:GAG-pre-integrase domain-containing protein n=1 Tax=Orchesella cincta TaxID=48709 RepID=A0A1D2MWB9_ORCCI|nr:hypothetical protein Ocin01_09715 [Orchesella cincta]
MKPKTAKEGTISTAFAARSHFKPGNGNRFNGQQNRNNGNRYHGNGGNNRNGNGYGKNNGNFNGNNQGNGNNNNGNNGRKPFGRQRVADVKHHTNSNNSNTQRANENENLESTATAFIASTRQRNNQWISDSGHPSTSQGEMTATYVPGAVNLFSEGQLAQKGYKIIRDSTTAVFYDTSSSPVLTADMNNNVYIMRFRPLQQHALVATSKLWHSRLAHVNIECIKNTVKNNAARGIQLDELIKAFKCEDCHFGKEKDCPSLVLKIECNARLDEGSSFRMAYFLKKKSETAACIKKFISFIETQTRIKLSCSDRTMALSL